uniref:(northern house mosquito) hypothetical protein n=1 Tax=Culex pipiens TaxID=7175 RepID=A0A8D8FDD5_CULPI
MVFLFTQRVICPQLRLESRDINSYQMHQTNLCESKNTLFPSQLQSVSMFPPDVCTKLDLRCTSRTLSNRLCNLFHRLSCWLQSEKNVNRLKEITFDGEGYPLIRDIAPTSASAISALQFSGAKGAQFV